MSDPNRKCPPLVAWLGHGGLLPFIGLALLVVADPLRGPMWAHALVGYGAVILSFVGALHWGVAMLAPTLDPAARRRAYLWSVVPALVAWPATLLAGPAAGVILLFGFASHLMQDLKLAGPAALPAWYLPLRWRLTVVAWLCLLINIGVGMARG